MCRATWPVGKGSQITTYLESPTQICLFIIQLLGGSGDDSIKGSLLMSLPTHFLAENCPTKTGLKIHFWGFRRGQFLILKLRPPRKSIPPEYVVWRKNGGDTPKNVFSRAAQEITKIKKNIWTWYFTPLPEGGGCWTDCCKFLRVGWHPRRNHAYQILSRLPRGFGATGVQNRGFPIHFQTALTTLLHTTVLHCDIAVKYYEFGAREGIYWSAVISSEMLSSQLHKLM